MMLSERDLDILSELVSSVQLIKDLREISTELTDKEVENLNDYVLYYWNVIDPIKDNKAPYINKISEEVENTIDTIIKRHREEFSAPSSGKVTIDYKNLMQYFKKYVLTKTDDELISICGLKTQDSISDDGPQFILPSGDVLLGTIAENGNSDMHSRLIEYVCDKTFENEFGSRFYKDYQDYNVEDVQVMSVMTYERGWLRVNPGTRSVEDRFYCVLPNKVTSAQYEMLEQFLDLGSIKTNKVLVFATSYRDDHTYYFDNNTTDDIIKKIKRYYSNGYFVEDLKEELLLEKTRNDLINKSKNADSYKDQSKGKNRYERRRLSRIANSVAQYNKIDMDAFFKRDILTVGIDVQGETNNYVVTMRFKDVLQEIQREVKANNGKLEFKIIAKAMSRVFNTGDVQIHCTCLHPSTKIKLLDGTNPTVEEMCKRFEKGEKLWVFSTDENGDFKPGEVEKVWQTKTTQEFVRVTLDNGEEILTTPEHPYMLRDGSYSLAMNLQAGQSLMPLYFNESNGYLTVKLNTEARGWKSVYKLVAEELKKSEILEKEKQAEIDSTDMTYKVAIHHKDFNKNNNNPNNLQVMTSKEHWNYHANLCGENRPITERMRESARENAHKRNENPTERMIEQREQFIQAGAQRNYDEDRRQLQSEIMSRVSRDFWDNPENEEKRKKVIEASHTKDAIEKTSKSHKKLWQDMTDEEYQKRCEQNRLSNMVVRDNKLRVIVNRIIENNLPLNEDSYSKVRKEKEITLKRIKMSYGSFNAMLDKLGYTNTYNHKIVKVERIILDDTPVYDIKVKTWENFLVDAGVVLHNCPDAKYRQNYWQWKNGDGTQYEPRPSDKTNPNDTKGAGCKHTLLVLSNLDWIMKVSSVLNNYIKYCQKNLQNNYATYMFPKIYGVPYSKGVQMSIFDTGLLPQDQKTLTDIATTNMKDKDAKGRWIKGNSYVFQKNPNTPPKRVVDPNQLTIDDIENQDTKKKELVASAPVGTTTQEVDTKKQEQENGKDTKKKEMDTTIYRRALTIDDFDEEGNLVGNGVLIKDKRKNKPGAGRPKKVRQDDPDQLRLNFDDLDDEEND